MTRRVGLAGLLLVGLAACSTSPDPALAQQRWTDLSGRTLPIEEIVSFPGPEHCDWESITFLYVGRDGPDAGKEYLRDPGGILLSAVRGTFASAVELPTDARDSGYRRKGTELWLTDDAAYLVTGDRTERWPRANQGIGCA